MPRKQYKATTRYKPTAAPNLANLQPAQLPAAIPTGSYIDENGVRISERTGKPVRTHKRRSLRAYRREIDDVISQMKRGVIGPKQGQAIIAGLQAAAEAYLAERRLQIAGIEDVEDENHILGEDGGAPEFDEMVQPQEHRISRRRGIGADGNVIDEQEIESTGGKEVLKGQQLLEHDERDEL